MKRLAQILSLKGDVLYGMKGRKLVQNRYNSNEPVPVTVPPSELTERD